ncbi:MAG: O-antigen ligase family protein [Polyangiaceae bacterium]
MSDSEEQTASQEEWSAPSQPQKRRRRRTLLGRARHVVGTHLASILTYALFVTILVSLLAVGTVHVVSLLVVTPLALLAGGLVLWTERQSERRFPAPAIVLAALSLYSLIQSIPLPPSWVQALSPVAARTWSDAFVLAGAPVGHFRSLSVDPSASRVEALKWLAYASIFVASARLAREKGGNRGLVIVVVSALVGGVLSVAHGLAGVSEWFYVYKPQFAYPQWAPAPLLNPNNFAGYLNLALLAGMGLFFARKPPVPRWLSAFAIVLLAALVILTGSRGGVLALIVGFAASGVAFRIQQVRAQARGHVAVPTWIPLASVGLAATTLAVIGANEPVWQQLLDETTSKLRIIEYCKAIVADHLWIGVGRGAFGTAFAAYRQEIGDFIAHYAENFVVQWIVEWGLPVAVLGLVGLFVSMWKTRRTFTRSSQQTAAILAVLVLLLQNLVDLGTEIPSVAFAAFSLLGTAYGTSEYVIHRKKASGAEPKGNVRAVAATGVFAFHLFASFGLVFLVAVTAATDVIDQRASLAEELTGLVGKPKGDPGFAALRQKVTTQLLRFPADPHIPVLGALLTRESGKSPFTWLNQALRRDRLNARAHLLLSDTLAARGAASQALLELKLTAKYSPALVGPAADRAVKLASDLDTMVSSVPEGPAGAYMLNALAVRSPASSPLRARLLELSFARDGNNEQTHAIAFGDVLAAIDSDAEACRGRARGECEARLRRHAAVATTSKTNPQIAITLTAQSLAHEGKFDEAERWLGEHCGRAPDPGGCNAARVSYALRLSDAARFESAALAYTAAACTTSAACANAFTWLGHLELGQNRQLMALSRFERAAEEHPSADAWLRVAELAARAGRVHQSTNALTKARRLGGEQKAEELEKRLTELRRERILEDFRTLIAPARSALRHHGCVRGFRGTKRRSSECRTRDRFRGSNPSARSFVTSVHLRGVPSGFDVSNSKLPS